MAVLLVEYWPQLIVIGIVQSGFVTEQGSVRVGLSAPMQFRYTVIQGTYQTP